MRYAESKTVLPPHPTYDDWVALGSEVVRSRSSEQQHAVARGVLKSLLPPGFAEMFK